MGLAEKGGTEGGWRLFWLRRQRAGVQCVAGWMNGGQCRIAGDEERQDKAEQARWQTEEIWVLKKT